MACFHSTTRRKIETSGENKRHTFCPQQPGDHSWPPLSSVFRRRGRGGQHPPLPLFLIPAVDCRDNYHQHREKEQKRLHIFFCQKLSCLWDCRDVSSARVSDGLIRSGGVAKDTFYSIGSSRCMRETQMCWEGKIFALALFFRFTRSYGKVSIFFVRLFSFFESNFNLDVFYNLI